MGMQVGLILIFIPIQILLFFKVIKEYQMFFENEKFLKEEFQMMNEKINDNLAEINDLPSKRDQEDELNLLQESLSKNQKITEFFILSCSNASQNENAIHKEEFNSIRKAYIDLQKDVHDFHLQDIKDMEIFLNFFKSNCKIDENLSNHLFIIFKNIKQQGFTMTKQMMALSSKVREIFVNIMERNRKFRLSDENNKNNEMEINAHLSQEIGNYIREYMEISHSEIENYFENQMKSTNEIG